MKQPNGLTSYLETHFHVSHAIQAEASKDTPKGIVQERIEKQGTGGLYELAEELTDKFEELHKGREWDGEFFDEIDEFLKKELYGQK